VLEPLHSQGAEYYNDDAKLGGAINDAVFRANAVHGWAGGLQALSMLHKKGVAELLALEELDLKGITTAVPIWDGLGGLMQIGKLKKLGLTAGCKLGAAGLKRLAVELATAPLLEELELEDNDLVNNETDYSGVDVFGASLATNGRLRVLGMNYNKLGPRGAAGLAQGLAACKSLVELSLAGNNLTNNGQDMSGVIALAAAVKDSQISTLNVDGHPLPIDELKGIKPVDSIDLSGKRIDRQLGIASTIIIGACIKGNEHLRQLNLADNNLTDYGEDTSGVIALAAALKDSQITSLNLADNNLTNYGRDTSGVIALAAALKESQISDLNLADNNLTNFGKDMSGVLALAAVLKDSQISTLNISVNGVDEATKSALLAARPGLELIDEERR